MTNGNNHAKKILIDDLNSSVKKTEESAGDIAVIGDTVCKTAKIVAAMFENNFRTVEDCDATHKEFKDKLKAGKTMKVKLGPASFDIPMTPALIAILPSFICCGACFVMLSKLLNWW